MQLAASTTNREALVLTHRTSFPEVVNAPFAIKFANVAKEKGVQATVMAMVQMWINYYGGDAAEMNKTEMALEVLQRKDWSLLDVVQFYRFVRDNATHKDLKIFGKPSLHNFANHLGLYEQEKAAYREAERGKITAQEPQSPRSDALGPEEARKYAQQAINQAEVAREKFLQDERDRRRAGLKDRLGQKNEDQSNNEKDDVQKDT